MLPAVPVQTDGTNATKSASSTTAATPSYKVPKFLRSLYSILQNEDNSVVTWLQNQELKPNRVTAFHILDIDRFENDVLPKYFKHSKFASFQRQLNNFGFRKWTKTQSSGVCTFSHNCFPPDPREIGVLRASIREQWRQKNTDSRRRVGNGITKAERKLQQQVQQHVQQLQGGVKPTTTTTNSLSSSSPMSSSSPVKSVQNPESSNSTSSSVGLASPSRVESFSEMLKTPLPTHQPQVKKLARPVSGEWVVSSGLEAFADSPAKSMGAVLPPIQTQPPLPHVSYNNTVNIGSFSAPTPIQRPEPTMYHPHMMMISTSSPTPTESWVWNQQHHPHQQLHTAYADVHHFHPSMEMATVWPHHVAHHDPSLVRKGVYCHVAPEQQVSPSTMEEFTFDSLLLFAE